MPASFVFVTARLQHLFRFICLVSGLAVLSACYREAIDASAVLRSTGTAPWTVDGVRPGQPFDDAKRILGEPREIRGTGGARVAHWSNRETMVTLNAASEIVEVWGRLLHAGNQTLIGPGSSEAEVTQTLGAGKSTRISSPGSGVISFGSKTTGYIFTYQNGGVSFEITVKEQSAQHVRAFLP